MWSEWFPDLFRTKGTFTFLEKVISGTKSSQIIWSCRFCRRTKTKMKTALSEWEIWTTTWSGNPPGFGELLLFIFVFGSCSLLNVVCVLTENISNGYKTKSAPIPCIGNAGGGILSVFYRWILWLGPVTFWNPHWFPGNGSRSQTVVKSPGTNFEFELNDIISFTGSGSRLLSFPDLC